MAMDDQFREPDTFFAIAERDGTVGGFLHVVPSGRGFSLEPCAVVATHQTA